MSSILVDSNVLIDVATEDSEWAGWSTSMLARVAAESALVINPLIYAEVSTRFASTEELDEALPPSLYHREALPYTAAFLAGKAFVEYRRRGGSRRSPLPDFYIGAHAMVARYPLLTRDPARYQTYFPTLEVIAPPA